MKNNFCLECGTERKEDAKFCVECGIDFESKEIPSENNKTKLNKNYLLITIPVIVVVLIAGYFMFVESSIVGKYVDQNKPNFYIELKSDGKFYSHTNSADVAGTYEVNGSELTLVANNGMAEKLKIQGNTIIETQYSENGQNPVLVKQ